MPFPYFQPIQPWAVNILKEREENKILSVYKNPFIVISSGAKVVKSTGVVDPKSQNRAIEIKKLLEENTPSKDVWKGCIIANSIGTHVNGIDGKQLQDLTYSLNETPVGIDFDGKIIKVEGETNRKVSMPIIESMDLDTDGANNTLKEAKITVRCFTLKQLEMFEMFFLKPGLNVLVEFGDSTLEARNRPGVIGNNARPGQTITNKTPINATINGEKVIIEPYTNISEAFVPKKDYLEFCRNFSKYFRSDTSAIADYLETIRRSVGSYDRVAGKVLEFGYSANDDGTYTVTFNVSQGNQIAFASPKNPGSKSSNQKTGTPNAVEFTSNDQIINQMVADFNIEKEPFTKLLNNNSKISATGKWEDEFFNFLKINKEQKDTIASDRAYISLRFILAILLNYSNEVGGSDENPFFKLEMSKYRLNEADPDDKAIPIIPVRDNKFLISSDESIIYPKKELIQPFAPNNSKVKDATEVILDGTTVGTINGIDFSIGKSIIYQQKGYSEPIPEVKISDDVPLGNALNIFLDYKKVVEYWNKSYTRIDFLENVLSLINTNSYGLFQLILGVQKENGPPVVMNYRWSPTEIQQSQNIEIYRFKPTTIKSTVKQFTFDFQMDNLVAGMTLFNTRRVLSSAKNKTENTDVLPLPPQAYHSVDNAIYANADGWYSINQIEFENLTVMNSQIKTEVSGGIQRDSEQKNDATTEAVNLDEVIKGKSKKFIINQQTDDTKLKTLIYLHKDLIQKSIGISPSEKGKSVVSPISVTLTIDGFSGLTSGEYFEIDGIPELYNKIGVFQITNIKHNVSKDGWTTTIEADHHIINKKL